MELPDENNTQTYVVMHKLTVGCNKITLGHPRHLNNPVMSVRAAFASVSTSIRLILQLVLLFLAMRAAWPTAWPPFTIT